MCCDSDGTLGRGLRIFRKGVILVSLHSHRNSPFKSLPYPFTEFQFPSFIKTSFSQDTRKENGFKSLRVNCCDIDKVVSKYQMYFSEKTCKKRSKTEK